MAQPAKEMSTLPLAAPVKPEHGFAIVDRGTPGAEGEGITIAGVTAEVLTPPVVVVETGAPIAPAASTSAVFQNSATAASSVFVSLISGAGPGNSQFSFGTPASQFGEGRIVYQPGVKQMRIDIQSNPILLIEPTGVDIAEGLIIRDNGLNAGVIMDATGIAGQEWAVRSHSSGQLQIRNGTGARIPVRVGSDAAENLLTLGLAEDASSPDADAMRIGGSLYVDSQSFQQQIPQPASPSEGGSITWLSDGTGTAALGAAAGDVVTMVTEGGVTKAKILFVFASEGTVIPP